MRGRISDRAYYGCLGWAYAKYVATMSPWAAFRLWFQAVRHGCYRPGLALIVLLQIFLPDGSYRRIADKALRDKLPKPPRLGDFVEGLNL